METTCGMRQLMAAGLLAVLGLVAVTRAQDEVIPMDRVPKSVINAAKARFPGAEIKQATEETEDETKVYSLQMKHQRHDLDVTFKADGTLVLAETAVPQKELPKVLLRAVASQYPGASLRHAAAVKNGPGLKKTADYYELYLLNGDKRPRLVKVDPKGKVLEDPYPRLHHAQPRQPLNGSPGPVGP